MKKIDFGLYIVATPIGNLDDISKRSIEIIENADFIICENPKHSLKLLNNLGIKKKLISLHDYNEHLVVERIAKDLNNKKIVLISDAGSPLISDPGYKLVNFCIKNKIPLTSIPGPSSIIPALQLSGIPINQFLFAGFFPKTTKAMVDFVEIIKELNHTTVFFVSNHKIIECLKLLEEYMPERLISVSKELTKLNEHTYRGKIKDIRKTIFTKSQNTKGEFVITLNKNIEKNKGFDELKDKKDEIKKLLKKFSLTDVVEIVHKLTGITKNKVYKWVLSIKKS